MAFHLPKSHHQIHHQFRHQRTSCKHPVTITRIPQFRNILPPTYNRRQYLKTSYFYNNMEKEANFVIFKINIISNLMNTISKRVKAELKPSKIESSKHVSKSFT